MLAEIFRGAIGSIAGDISLAVKVSMIHNDDRKRRMSLGWDLHRAGNGQAIAWIADEITGKSIRRFNRRGDCDLATLKVMMLKSVNRDMEPSTVRR